MVGIHEAGRVVIGRMLGMPVAGSTINRVGDHILPDHLLPDHLAKTRARAQAAHSGRVSGGL
jgi:hypothetical protein